MMYICLHLQCIVSEKDMHYHHLSFFNFSLHCLIEKVQKHWEELQLNRTHELPCCADDINFLRDVNLSASMKLQEFFFIPICPIVLHYIAVIYA
jgi:hypothetical protein